MSRFADVVIAWDAGEKAILCKPDVVTVYYRYEKGPTSVRWIVESMPRAARRVEIKWETGSPFQHMGAEILKGKLCLFATGNRAVKGLFKYMILFLDGNDRVLAALDPGVRNEPEPGGGP